MPQRRTKPTKRVRRKRRLAHTRKQRGGNPLTPLTTVFICHDQHSVDQSLAALPSAKILFVGPGQVKPNDRVIVARTLPNQIESEKKLLTFTAWYAISKNNLFTDSNYICLLEWDVTLSPTFLQTLQRECETNTADVISFLTDSANFYTDIRPDVLNTFLQAKGISPAAYSATLTWHPTTNHCMRRALLDEFVDWYYPAVTQIQRDDPKKVSWYHERLFAAWVKNKKYVERLLPILRHSGSNSHASLNMIGGARLRKRQRGGQAPKREFHFFNRFHYGDNILNLKFFYVNTDILLNNNIHIHYYYDKGYIKNVDELERYVDARVVTLHPLESKPPSAIELWMGNPIDGISNDTMEKYYGKFYTNIKTILQIKENINTSVYQDEIYLNKIYDSLPEQFKNVDFLVINAQPMSGQFSNWNQDKMNQLCDKLKNKHKVVVTTCIHDTIVCTQKSGLKIQDIGAISTHAKHILAVHSGPFTACLNALAKQNVQKWYIMGASPGSYTQIPVDFCDTLQVLEDKLTPFF